jgi:hypothetical protein
MSYALFNGAGLAGPGARYQSNLRAAVLCGLQLLLVCCDALRLCDRHNFSLHSLTYFAISAQASARFPRCSLLDQAKLHKIPPKFTEILIRHPDIIATKFAEKPLASRMAVAYVHLNILRYYV